MSELFYAEVLNGIESVTRSANYSLLLANSDNDPDTERKSVQTLLETRVDGLLFCPTEKNDLSTVLPKPETVPIVLFINTSEGLSYDTVRVDRGDGAYQSGRYLIGKGYEEIYFFHTFAHMSESRNSVEGCRKAFRESGLPMERLKLVLCPERRLELFHQKAAEEIEYRQRRIESGESRDPEHVVLDLKLVPRETA